MQSIVNFDLLSMLPQTAQDIIPLVGKLRWSRNTHDGEEVYYYYDDEGDYYDPYYNNGDNYFG